VLDLYFVRLRDEFTFARITTSVELNLLVDLTMPENLHLYHHRCRIFMNFGAA